MNKYFHFKIIDSTSKYLKKNYKNFDNFTFVSADFQTEGHGRNNRKWESNEKENLLFSVLIKDKEIIKKYDCLSLASACAIYKTLSELNIEGVSIKWPNDVFVNDKKISGILLEGISYGNKIEAIIIGIGLNVNSHKFNDKMMNKPTSIYLETNIKSDLDALKDKVFINFMEIINNVKNGDKSYLETAKNHNYLKDKVVCANINNMKSLIKVIDINDDNSLKVRRNNEYINLYSGEITFNL